MKFCKLLSFGYTIKYIWESDYYDNKNFITISNIENKGKVKEILGL